MRMFVTAFAFQLRLAWREPDNLQLWVTAPLLTLVFLGMSEHAGRPDLAPYALVGPTLISLWMMALLTAGQLITEERNIGTLEALVATPAKLSTVVLGRIFSVTILGGLSFVEAWLVAGLTFGRWLHIHHPVAFAACLAATTVAMAGTASILSPLFVLMPTARTIQNTLSYPFYLLGGILVPVSYLPEWIRPLSRLIFLSWSSDVLRDSLAPRPLDDLGLRLGAVLVLAALGYLTGMLLLRRVLVRVRQLGTLSQT